MKKKHAQLNTMYGAPEKKLVGPGFWMIFSLTVIDEFMDVFLNLTFILSFVTVLSGLIVSFIVYFYLFYNGVSFTTRKLATMFISFLIEMIPFLNMFPTYPFTLIMVRWLENNERIKKFAGKKALLQRMPA